VCAVGSQAMLTALKSVEKEVPVMLDAVMETPDQEYLEAAALHSALLRTAAVGGGLIAASAR
jgi:hypothetical protein